MEFNRAGRQLGVIGFLTSMLTLSGCLMDEPVDSSTSNDPSTTSVTNNLPPQITGIAASTVMPGNDYSFVPTATDPDSDALAFNITNRPAWAGFDSISGELSGTPQTQHVGVYSGITISVTDGELTTSLNPFSVSVDETALGSVTLSWISPTENTDGSALTDLAGYRIYYGTSVGNYPNKIVLDTPGLSTYVVENLVPGSYFFVSTATNSQGIESGFSNVAQRIIN